jgi:DNA-directed RNA polymerase, subunit H, RpoH/RPB5
MSKSSSSETSTEEIPAQLLPIEKNYESRLRTILTNIVKMLTERNLLKLENLDKNTKKITSIKTDDNIYRINLDLPENHVYGKNNNEMIIRIINQKIKNYSKTSTIAEFINQFKNHPKIIVVLSISTKIRQLIQNDKTSPFTEIFLEKELLINIVDHVSVPKHIVLSAEMSKKVLEDYHIKKKEIPKILLNDPISRYYNVKPGQIFKIIRPSETTCTAPYYRMVVKGLMKES